MNVCLIPCFDRAELLAHTLRNIEAARGAADILFLFKPDHKTKPEVLEVISTFTLPFQIIPYGEPPRIPRLMRQSWNVLTGYGVAARTAGPDGLVYMIESDVIVDEDFFEWHEAGRDFPHFCSIGSEDTNTPEEKRADWPRGDIFGSKHDPPRVDDTIWEARLTEGTFRSIGVCFRASVLHDLIAPHVCDAYFLSPQRYVGTRFPVNPWGTSWCEQDGLIRRIQLNQPLPIAYPFRPRCYHAGYYGGNRGNARYTPKGSLQERIEAVGRVIYSREAMRAHAPNEAFYLDSVPTERHARA